MPPRSSTLDLRQVDERVRIVITWSTPHPEMAGQTLEQIAQPGESNRERRRDRLQPAGAIYHSMSEEDVRRILQHPATMIGSDGLPNDPLPHPRLWGTFPRVLGHYCREQGLFPLAQAMHKMTGMPAQRFGLAGRGQSAKAAHADLVLFDPETIKDTPLSPTQSARRRHRRRLGQRRAVLQGRGCHRAASRALSAAPAHGTMNRLNAGSLLP